MKSATILLGVFVTLAACATTKQMAPLGGSRADGIVKLGFTHAPHETFTVNEIAALSSAKDRCRAWGYENADPFGDAVKRCISQTADSCTQFEVTRQYQCIGGMTGSS